MTDHADIGAYLALITDQHNQQPNYVQSVSVSVQPFADGIALLNELVEDFDLDEAIGVQLDAVGVRVGRSRYLTIPLNVYFSWGVPHLGWGEGIWKGPFDALDGLARLPDDPYRILLRAVIVANVWDGTIPDAYRAWNDVLFANTPFRILIQDYGDETMAIALVGEAPDAITKALFTTGELDLKPAAVTLYHVLPTVYPAGASGGTPLFGWGADNDNIGGWGHGAWAAFVSSE